MVSFNTQPPEGGWAAPTPTDAPKHVSTHSRLKAAGPMVSVIACQTACFNTQPPEGGWLLNGFLIHPSACFNTQPPEGGWAEHFAHFECAVIVSTHSRLKAAGLLPADINIPNIVSTHSRLKAAGVRISCVRLAMRFQHTAA